MGSWPFRFSVALPWAALSIALAACSGDESVAPAGPTGGSAPTDCSPDGTVAYCYPGPATSRGVGECQDGTHTCVGGTWDECAGYVLPTDEICDDHLDNNCNGVGDEGCACNAGSIRPCYTGPATTQHVGMCSDGEQACIDGTWDDTCEGQVLPSADEPCNEVDDNCNGAVDEGCSCTEGATRACYQADPATQHIGECRDGTQSCVDGLWSEDCPGQITPTPELCNGLDDDCDGQTDEELGATTCGLGPCEHTVQNCVNHVPQTCDPMQGATTETCDGGDNDCDGQVDEGCSCVDGTTQPCYTGSPPSSQNNPPCHAGTQTCANGAWGACNGQVTPATEVCNGVDDDCDAAVDDNLGTTTCGLGPCYHSQQNCVGGQPQACDPYLGATSETCNNIDDNCNGTVDDGLGTTFCGVGQCYHGQQNCVNGLPVSCNPMQGSSAETCDGVDNDCDGSTDEGNPGGGAACTTGQYGICSAGTRTCQGGTLVCVRNQNPTSEICNNLDDDCDNQTDEGNPGGGAACTTGQYGICSAGTRTCQGGTLVCVRNQNPTSEICNGLDDDCDNQTDEGLGSTNCGLGQCNHDQANCVGGTPRSCDPLAGASSETCDGVDNDCDGTIDNGTNVQLCGDPYWYCYLGACYNTCPVLYTWNGTAFGFEADLYGSGKLGVEASTGIMRPQRNDYYVLAQEPAPLDGSFELRIVEERNELNYFDGLGLYAVNLPSGHDLYAELHGVGAPDVPLEESIHTVQLPMRAPVSAVHVDTGDDIWSLVSASDHQHAQLSNDRNLDFDYNTVELDLGDLSGAPQIKLVVDAVTAFPSNPQGIARKKLFGARTRLEVDDGLGGWWLVPSAQVELAPPKEVRRPYVVDLTGLFPSTSYRVRLTFLFKTYIDSLLVDTSADLPVTLEPLALEDAQLRWYGQSTKVGGELFEWVYGAVDQIVWPAFPGFYTGYGDVTPVLTDVDDQHVIFWGGDEVAVRFTPASPPVAGERRRYLLHATGYYKDASTSGPKTVEPLPFGAMSNYPYALLEEQYPSDPEHVAYRATYNTRWLP